MTFKTTSRSVDSMTITETDKLHQQTKAEPIVIRYFLATPGGGYMTFAGTLGNSPTVFWECNECEWIVPETLTE